MVSSVLFLLIFLLLALKCRTMINLKLSKDKLEIMHKNHTEHTMWHSSVPYDKMVGVHEIITKFNVTHTDLLYQMSRLVGSKLVPVVFICYNRVPRYLRHTIEMAARLNPVILINDMFSQPAISSPFSGDSVHSSPMPVFYLPLSYKKINDVIDFESVYEPIYLNDLPHRLEYEKRCFLRWLVLANTVATFNLPYVFYADNDVVVTGNVTTAWAIRRDALLCDVMLSVQGDQPPNEKNWIGHLSGHSSFWSQDSLQDLKDFFISMYRMHKETLKVSGRLVSTSNGHNRVVDQSLLYLYYVAHHLGSAMWDAGRPQSFGTGRLRRTAKPLEELWSRYDFKFKQARDAFGLPRVSNPTLVVCNGLDVVDRSCFDHMHAFHSTHFSLNINVSNHELVRHYHRRHQPMAVTYYQWKAVSVHDPLSHLLPHVTGLTSYYGGRAESLDEKEAKELGNSNVYFYSLHYQGLSKNWISIDVCRRLLSRTQYYMEQFYNPHVRLSELEKVLGESDAMVEEYLLNRLIDPLVRKDCEEVLKHRDNLLPYADMLKD